MEESYATATVTSTKEKFYYRFRDFWHHYNMSAWDAVLDFILRNHPGARNSNIVQYAEDELRLSDWYDEDAVYDDLVPKAVLRGVRLFSIEGHSGMSAPLVNNITTSVCMFKPLTPLTGEDDEWMEVFGGKYQNKRFSSVFKESKDGKAYWMDGKVFREPNGAVYTSINSRVYIDFPWMPTSPEIVDVKESVEDD